MAITVMATVEKTSKATIRILALSTCFIISPISLAGEWAFTPSVGLTETYSDNVELKKLNSKSSLVSQLTIELTSEFKSKKAFFSFSGAETLVAYSHDSKLNDDFQTMELKGLVSLWSNGPELFMHSSISNVSINDRDNSEADLISGGTTQQRNHYAGLQYNIVNNHHDLSSSLIYNIIEAEDNIGDRDGYKAIINSKNGNAAKVLFWQIDGQLSYQENERLSGKSYSIESKIGAISHFKVNPFIRFYNEKITGSLTTTKPNTNPSWGPGIQWLVKKHFIVDLSYNYLLDDTITISDYVAATIDWQPSERTSLKANYSQRFFGDSYNVDFQHRTKRLTNAITYNEEIEVFDRNSYVENSLGQFWCPDPISSSVTPDECSSSPPNDTAGYSLISFSDFTPVVNEEFTLNKRLVWTSKLALARTTFEFVASIRKRQILETNIIDSYLNADFTITRKISAKNKLNLRTSYNKNIFDKNRPINNRQKDIYKTISITYSRNLGSSLTSLFTLQFLDRESSRIDRNYNEARASLNIKKDF